MGAVPPQRAGMASATSNASREIGGVFGIALLGAIVTRVFTRDLDRVVAQLNLPPAVKATILQQASHGIEQTGGSLPAGSSFGAVTEALKASFVSGMHLALIVAGGVLLAGAVVAGVFVRGHQTHPVASQEYSQKKPDLLTASAEEASETA
jgi:hypothetical protein